LKRHIPIIGWREYVDFPEWGIQNVEAKVDTGARTSALHVDNIERTGTQRVRFDVILSRKDSSKRVSAAAPLVRVVRVRSSNGEVQERYVVSTSIVLGHQEHQIETSLVCRRRMRCRMLLGRTALAGYLIDVNRVHESRSASCESQPRKRKPNASA
jgi:hypothetical protein